jgi:hypothetical protein
MAKAEVKIEDLPFCVSKWDHSSYMPTSDMISRCGDRVPDVIARDGEELKVHHCKHPDAGKPDFKCPVLERENSNIVLLMNISSVIR